MRQIARKENLVSTRRRTCYTKAFICILHIIIHIVRRASGDTVSLRRRRNEIEKVYPVPRKELRGTLMISRYAFPFLSLIRARIFRI